MFLWNSLTLQPYSTTQSSRTKVCVPPRTKSCDEGSLGPIQAMDSDVLSPCTSFGVSCAGWSRRFAKHAKPCRSALSHSMADSECTNRTCASFHDGVITNLYRNRKKLCSFGVSARKKDAKEEGSRVCAGNVVRDCGARSVDASIPPRHLHNTRLRSYL